MTWPGKREPLLAGWDVGAPQMVRLCETWPNPRTDSQIEPNKLFHGDNLATLEHLCTSGYRGQVRLIYADPPYNSGVTWPRKVRLRTQGAAGRAPIVDHQTQYTDAWTVGDYLQFVYERLWLMRDLLTDDGALWLHCDHRHAHHLRSLLDEVFGPDNYLNTITWRSQTARGAKVNAYYFANSAHSIHIYAKNRRSPCLWHQPRKRHVLSEAEASAEFMHDRLGFFRTSDPGAYSFARLKELHAAGRLYAPHAGEVLIDEVNRRMICSNGGNLGVKYYLTNLGNGHYAVERAVDNVWDDIPGLGTTPNEDVGYPTQKTEALLRRIIETSTNAGDLILDPFVGSGTAVVVAEKLGRRWLGCDLNYGAIQTTRRRIQRTTRAQSPGVELYRVSQVTGVEKAYVQPSLLAPHAVVDVTGAPGDGEFEVHVRDYGLPGAPVVDDWRALVESIDIDPAYDGSIFRGTLADAPNKRGAQVRGSYRLAAPTSSPQVAVRITDVWGRETTVIKTVGG